VSDEPAGRLLELAVADLGLIDRVRLELGTGLNVITGETGAGKSLLIDALGLALGARVDTGLVRHGAERARVEALFERLPEPLIVVREVQSGGRSTARLDDEPVTAARLAETAGGLVEIHGQHDQQRLLDERVQRDLLDAYGGTWVAREAVAGAVERWRANRASLAELTVDPRELVRRLDLAEHEAAEIAAARVRIGEVDEIQARLGAARHGETIARGGAAIHAALVGEGSGEDGGGGERGAAREGIATAGRQARELARFDPRFDPLAERLAGLDAEVDDVAAEVRALVDDLDHDAAAVASFEERLSLIFALERRYGDDEAAVLAHGEAMAAEAERLSGVEGERGRRLAEDAVLLAEVARTAGTLSGLRAEAAERLAAAVSVALEELGFARTRFEVALGRRPAGRDEPAIEVGGDALAFDASGIDEVVFRFAPNVGEPPRPLARIASGGELSRVALAIKEVLAAADATPTLVFDEIDAGIGGRSADPVGRSLWTLARRHQVLCVTHLPQIAAHADVHFRIAKHERDGRTVTEVVRLDDEAERVEELAQMLGGPAGGDASVAGARELLERAGTWRQGIGRDRPAVRA
jgi:DNA repair protein RecN (Recombination protein N)